MTKTSAPSDETATTGAMHAASTAFDGIQQTMDTLQARVEIPSGLREVAQRTAAAARDQAESAHAAATKATAGAERLAASFVATQAEFCRGVFDAAFANVRHALGTVEKLAAARTLTEAVQIQAEYVRDNAQANLERLRTVAENARAVAEDGTQQLRKEFGKLQPGLKAA